MSELVEIPLTRNRFESEIIKEAVRSEGYEVHLVGPSIESQFDTPTVLVVHSADVDAITEIIARSQPAG